MFRISRADVAEFFEPLRLNDDPEFIAFRERHLDILSVIMVSIGVVLILLLGGLDYMLGLEPFDLLALSRFVIAVLLALDLAVDILRGRTRQRIKFHIYLGFYLALAWVVVATLLLGDLSRVYWAQFNLILIAWFAFVPYSYREIALNGLFFILVYNAVLLILLHEIPARESFIEINAYFLGTAVMGTIVSFLNNRSAAQLFATRQEIEIEKRKSDDLLHNILPSHVADRLKSGEGTIADRIDAAGVMFADIVGFTELTARVDPERIVSLLDEIFREFDALAERFGLEKIKTIGDAYMVVSGLAGSRSDHLIDIARMSLAMRDTITRVNAEGVPLQIRIGLDVGPVVAGVIGRKRPAYDLWGDTVNTASRMESHGDPQRIQTSADFAARLEGRFRFVPRGELDIKGKGAMRTFWLEADLQETPE